MFGGGRSGMYGIKALQVMWQACWEEGNVHSNYIGTPTSVGRGDLWSKNIVLILACLDIFPTRQHLQNMTFIA